jgi:CubicO group peptidase (beta-lactamase class C family)
MRKTARTWIAAWMVLAAATLQAQPAWPTKDWETATPEAEGVDSHALAGLVTFGTANQMDSLLVARHGRIVLESYWGPFEPGRLHTINSATKSVLSALVGIAIEQGALPAADTPVLALTPGRKAANVDPRKQALQLRHLLDMTSGLDWIEPLADAVPETALQMYRSRDWTQFVLDRPMAHAPGEVFNYSSGNSQLLCAILGQAVGMRAEAFAAKNLLQPLGITQWRWRQDPGGNSTGGFGLYLQPRDMAKFGLLYLRHGQWEGRQLVPRAWVERTFQAGVPMNLGSGTDFRYGNGWWALPARKAFMAVGFHRQLIVLLPDADVVAVTTARSSAPRRWRASAPTPAARPRSTG